MIEPEGTTRPTRALRELAVAGAAVVLLAVVGWLWLSSRAAPARKPSVAVTGADYAGSRSCRGCHPGESAAHDRSGHARTLRPAGSIELVRWLDGRSADDPEFPGSNWTYRLHDGRLIASHGGSERVLDYALGSGVHAVTFLSLDGRGADGRPTSREHRLTYFAHKQALDVTPGQRAETGATGRSAEGRDLSADETMGCMGCHSTRLSAADDRVVDSATLTPDVSCERCHGPARDHVEAAQRGGTTRLPFGRAEGAKDVALCGQCHRLPGSVPPAEIRPDNLLLTRFQPVGLLQSQCYLKSRGALGCSTCHDPHDRTSREVGAYEAACLSCHREAPAVQCPVSPWSDCLGCHMPKRNAGNGLSFTDHWVRIPSR